MNDLIVKEYLGNMIEFKMMDGHVYANATSMCKAFNKLPKDWLKTKQTIEYINELERKENYPNGLVIVTQGGVASEQGTWIHEKLVLDLARWLNTPFRVWCDEQIETLLRDGRVEIQRPTKFIGEKTNLEILEANGIALNNLFKSIGLNIPKEIIVSTAINETRNAIGYDFPEVKKLLSKQDEERYHSASGILKQLGIKRNRTNETLVLLGLQVKGTTSMQPYLLTELGKEYGVERAYTNGKYQGYEVKWKESLVEFIKEHISEIPQEWITLI